VPPMTDGIEVTCGACGHLIEGDLQSSTGPDREPCPNCGSLDRGVNVHVGASMRSASHFGGAASHVTASISASGTVSAGSPDADTFVGQSAGHSCRVLFTKPDMAGFFTARVVSQSGDTLAEGYGNDTIDALLQLIAFMLPPEDPKYGIG
jgi:hypothetical protein